MERERNKQQVVETLLRRIVSEPDFPAFTEHITNVMQVVESDESSFRTITNMILKDVSLTLKILRTANSPYFNRSGREILTVTHAVAMLGLDVVRDIAGGMMLFEHFRNKSAGTRELTLLSLLSANHCRATASRVEYRPREETYLCGMFRNLGELLVSCYFPHKYAAILARAREFSVSEHSACLRVIECSYEDLGKAAARFWRMPKCVRACMKNDLPRITTPKPAGHELLYALISFGHGLTSVLHRKEPLLARGRLDYLLMTHGSVLHLTRDDLDSIAAEAISETKATFDLLKIPLDELRLKKQTENVLRTVEESRDMETDTSPSAAAGKDLLERLTDEVDLVICTRSTTDLTRIVLMAMEAVYRGLPCRRVIFALVDSSHTSLNGRLGLGNGIDTLIEKFSFPLSIRSGPLALAMLGKQEVIVRDSRYGNSALVQTTGSSSFALLPVVVDDAALGCFYLDWEGGTPEVDDTARQHLSRLRKLAGEALAFRKAAAPVSG